MLDHHKARDHVWHTPLSLLWKTHRGFIVTIFISWDKPKALDRCLSLVFVLSLLAREFTPSLKRLSLKLLLGAYILKKWQGLAIVIKGPGLMAKTCGASVFQPPPSLFLPKDRGPFPLQPCHQASHKHVEGALRLTFSPLTWRITNNCQTNKEKCSSFWETAKRLQYVLGNDLSF